LDADRTFAGRPASSTVDVYACAFPRGYPVRAHRSCRSDGGLRSPRRAVSSSTSGTVFAPWFGRLGDRLLLSRNGRGDGRTVPRGRRGPARDFPPASSTVSSSFWTRAGLYGNASVGARQCHWRSLHVAVAGRSAVVKSSAGYCANACSALNSGTAKSVDVCIRRNAERRFTWPTRHRTNTADANGSTP
jgi:hypothetical protein